MISRIHVAAGLIAILLPTTGAAQDVPSLLRPTASIGAGVATGQATGAGWNLLGSLEFGRARQPLRLRFDGQLTQWHRPYSTYRIGAFTGNLVSELRPAGARPFVVAGAGGYVGTGTGIRPGWNAGIGFVLPVASRDLVLESRWHQWYPVSITGGTETARYFVPLALRLRF